ncbi:putative alpha/beta superfamily hydrolase [Lacibacter cauensis]|uniref:Putative alpha/beta superfamily hydrolase n=1 Tax=Lacibacter cauensis TaxID=510947 RepID=A0A562SW12_9BACT|nr:alpha/beta hydrolase-fold protein [Lacibacter cauensis]TWI84986.1 putative alpha/beta superfamily hydrolase [Lacibacter cauensis]
MYQLVIAFMFSFTFLLQSRAQQTFPKVVSGRIERVANFQSKYVTARTVDIWLPEGYADTAKYAVLYMHDGQMLYDPEQSWNKQAWDVDDAAAALLAANKVRKFIIVGIWNSGQQRHPDYFPQKPFEQLTQTAKDTVVAQLQRAGRTAQVFQPQSDNYLKFIVQELKPFIDSKYAVHTNRENTFIAGSSMGGLISLYAICEYPNVFGGAACLSTHWPGTFTQEHNPVPDAFLHYVRQHLPDPKTHKIYFDCGDQTLDAWYPVIQKKVDALLQTKGYNNGNWMTKYFPGEDHSEIAWAKRVAIPLTFLLKN